MYDKRVEKTKHSLCMALITLMQEKKDISKISIKALTECANVSRKTFCNHYDRIEDIFVEIDDNVQDSFERQLKVLLKNDTFDVLHIYKAINNAMNQFPEYHLAIIHMNRYWIQINNSIALLKKHILKFYRSKNLTAGKDRLPYLDFYADYLSYGMLGMFHEWYVSDSGISLEDLSRFWEKVNGPEGFHKVISAKEPT